MAEFFEYYYPVAQQGESLYTFAEEVEREAGETRARRQAKVEVLPRKNWRRLASVAAVLVLMIFSSTVTAYALGYDPLAALTGWNREQAGEVVTAELIDLLAEYDASDLVPKWLPEGYAFDRFDNDMIGNRLGISAFFTAAGDKKMSINYTSWYNNEGVLSGGMSMNVESIQGLYESGFGDIAVYSTNNVDYYILGTDERRTVAWKNSVWGCTIVGNFSKDEAVKIINSIYE